MNTSLQTSGSSGMTMPSYGLPKPLDTLAPEDQSVVKSLALRGFFTGLLVAGAIGGAAVITTLSAMAFANMADKKKKPRRKRRRS